MNKLSPLTFFIVILVFSCQDKTKDQIQVTSIDQLPGLWNWESGGFGYAGAVVYSSKAHYATIEFTTDGRYIEMHNDTIFFTADYFLTKLDNISATMILDNFIGNPNSYQKKSTLIIEHNLLTIAFPDGGNTYSKIR